MKPNTVNTSKLVLEVDHSKAGMQGADKAKVQRIVNEISKNTPFYQNEQRKQDNREKRIAKLLRLSAEFDRLPQSKLDEIKATVDHELEGEIIACAHVARYAHLDMDAFHAACEELDNPELKNVPFGVGGMSMLGTSNYEARKYGVRAAMPGHIAKQLCPQLVLVPPHYEKYEAATKKIRAQAALFDPEFHSHGGDELCIKMDRAFYERTAALINERRRRERQEKREEKQQQKLQNEEEGNSDDQQEHLGLEEEENLVSWNSLSEKEAVTEVQRRVFDATKLTASFGVGPTRTLAKIASNFDKPNGQTFLQCRTVEEIKQHTWANLSVRQIPGIGKVTEMMLDRLGVKTCKEMYDNRYRLSHCFLPKTFSFLLASSVGLVGAVKSSKMKNRHSGFFVTNLALKKKLAKARGEEQEEDEDVEGYDDDDHHYLEYSSSDAQSDDEEAHQNPNKDNHKHSVGCERTFRIRQSTRAEALEKINRVYSKSLERLLHVAPCRVYQITIKAKKTNYSIANTSTNVQVLVHQKPKTSSTTIKQEEIVDDEVDNGSLFNQQQQQSKENEDDDDGAGWEEEDEGFDIVKLIGGSLSMEDYEMMKEKFTKLCESTGFIAQPSSYRLLGCRFSFQPGLQPSSTTVDDDKTHKKGNNSKAKAGVAASVHPSTTTTTLPERRQRTLDDFFFSTTTTAAAALKNNKKSDGSITTSDKNHRKNSCADSNSSVIDLDDDDETSEKGEDDEDDCKMMMMMMMTKCSSSRRSKNLLVQHKRYQKSSSSYMTLLSDDDDGNNDVIIDDDNEEAEEDADLFMMRNTSPAKNEFTKPTRVEKSSCDKELIILTNSSCGNDDEENAHTATCLSID